MTAVGNKAKPATVNSATGIEKPSVDLIRAVAWAGLVVRNQSDRETIDEVGLRAKLPDLGADNSTQSVELAARAAGLYARLEKISLAKFSNENCPFICKGADGDWHVITSVSHAGLATELTDVGKSQPVMLNNFADKDIIHGFSIRPLIGPERHKHAREDAGSFWPSRRILVPVIMATIVINLLALSIPLATMNIFDRVISNAAFETLWMLAGGVAIALCFDFTLRSLRASVLDRSSARSDVLAINAAFSHILGARMSARKSSIGMQVGTLREFESIRDYFNAAAISAFGDLPFVLLFLLVIYLVAGSLVIVPIIAVPLFLITALFIQMRLRRLVEGGYNDSAQKNSVATEILSGIESVKLARGEQWAARRWEQAVASQLRHSLAIRFWTNASLHLITFFQGMVTITILIVGVYSVTAGDITPGALFASNLLAARCLGPLVVISSLIARFTQINMAKRSLNELTTMDLERPEDRHLIKMSPPRQAIALENVSFKYHQDGADILKNLSMNFSVGERVAIIGGIGSGKTSMLQLLCGLHMPTSGRVLYDGLSTTDIDPDSLRSYLGVTPQNPAFMQGTVREAIAMGRQIDDGTLLRAVDFSGAVKWLRQTGLGLDTPVGERGAGLSAGQLQTLAVARAVAGQPPILLLDEPTSHLDGRSEAEFAGKLKALPQNTTLFVVTHRSALIDVCDRLVVMENGTAILNGPRDVVLAKLRALVENRGGKSPAQTGKAVVA